MLGRAHLQRGCLHAGHFSQTERSRRFGLTRPSAQVGFAGGLIALLFSVFLVAPFPIWAGTPSRPSNNAAGAEPIGWAGAAIMLVFVLAMWLPFRPYALAQRALERARVSTPWLIGATVLVALAAVLVYPGFGSD